MLKSLRHWLINILSEKPKENSAEVAQPIEQIEDKEDIQDATIVAYDEDLLENTKEQWLQGEWQPLAELTKDGVRYHPDRAKLILFAAAGHAQLGNDEKARAYTKLALDWGCSKKQVAQVLISGVYNNLISCANINAMSLLENKFRSNLYKIGIAKHDSFKLNQSSMYLKLQPRLIVINGMMRSGSTLCMNIVCDLLLNNKISFMKLYIDDFPDMSKLSDIINQNKNITFVLKTHFISDNLLELSHIFNALYIYSYRNIFEVAVSYLRMSKNINSPFFVNHDITVEMLIQVLEPHVIEYTKNKMDSKQKKISYYQLNDNNLANTIRDIALFLNINTTATILSEIAKKHAKQKSLEYILSMSADNLTSLGHEKNTFYHFGHIATSNDIAKQYLSNEWKAQIINALGNYVDEFGNIL